VNDESSHESFDGVAALYALGGLDQTEQADFEQHLEVCRACVDEVTSCLPVAHGLTYLAPRLEPPDRLRRRILGESHPSEGEPSPAPILTTFTGVEDEPQSPNYRLLSILALVVAIALALGLGWYTVQQASRTRALQARLDAAALQAQVADLEAATSRQVVRELRSHTEILAAADTVSFPLEAQALGRRPSGRAFVRPAGGLVVVASDMPPLSPGQTYQIWLVTDPDPVSAGVASVDSDGRLVESRPLPIDIADLIAIAVTREAEGGADRPSAAVVLLGRTALSEQLAQ